MKGRSSRVNGRAKWGQYPITESVINNARQF